MDSRNFDRVTVKGITFRGARFGLTPGCWFISKPIAKRIAEAYGTTLPSRVGYERALTDHYRERIANTAGRYRLSMYQDYTFENEGWKPSDF